MFSFIFGVCLGYLLQCFVVTVMMLDGYYKTKKEYLASLHPLFLSRYFIKKYESLDD